MYRRYVIGVLVLAAVLFFIYLSCHPSVDKEIIASPPAPIRRRKLPRRPHHKHRARLEKEDEDGELVDGNVKFAGVSTVHNITFASQEFSGEAASNPKNIMSLPL